jgi:hypothetical protein
LITLNNNEKWNSNGFKITSIHLLGGAINNNAIARNTTLGKAIERVVDDPEDNMLEYVYNHIENHDALGLLGAQHNLPLPRHYHERNIESELVPMVVLIVLIPLLSYLEIITVYTWDIGCSIHLRTC